MNARVIFVLSAAVLVGVTISYAQPQMGTPSPKTTTTTTTTPPSDSAVQKMDPIPGLLQDVAALKSEVAALKKENSAQVQQIKALEGKMAGAALVVTNLNKLVDKLKTEYEKHVHALPFDGWVGTDNFYVQTGGNQLNLISKSGAKGIPTVDFSSINNKSVNTKNPLITSVPKP